MRHFIAILALFPVAISCVAAEGPDLTGTILDADERPIAGATVQIYTAKVKEGTSPFCPSCYADCGKRASTDEKGAFKIASLDDELLFKVLVVAEGYSPQFMDEVDPASGPATARLSPVPDSRLKPAHRVEGRIVGPHGEPVVGATIEPYGMKTVRGSRYGGLKGVDPLAITGSNGEFTITADEPDLVLFAKVNARGLAPRQFNDLAAGEGRRELRMTLGSLVAGQVLHAGKPVPQAVVGIVGADRGAGSFVEETTIGVDQEGRFALPSVPAGLPCYLYVKRASIADIGATEIRSIVTGADGTITDAGTLNLVPGHTFSGRVRLSDGAAIPPKIRVMMSRDDAWDAIFTELDEEGRFELKHIPAGPYDVHIRIPGYSLSPKNRSLDPTYGRGLVGAIEKDIENVDILMEPERKGTETPGSAGPEQWEKQQALKKEPIGGVEAL